MNPYLNAKLQSLITDPELLATVIELNGFEVGEDLQVMPAGLKRIFKHGKVHATAAIAKSANDPVLIDELSLDNRQTVRCSLLTNPHVQQHHIEEIAKRSLKRDKSNEVFVKAARLLDSDRLLPLIQELVSIQDCSKWKRRTLPMKVAEVSGLDFLDKEAQDLRYVITNRIPAEGRDYAEKLLDIGYEDFLIGYPDGHISDVNAMSWYKAGMLEWLVPLLRPQLVPTLLQSLLINDTALTLADFNVVASVIEANLEDVPDVLTLEDMFHARHEPGVMEGLVALGHGWERFAYLNSSASNEIRLAYLRDADHAQLEAFPVHKRPKRLSSSWNVAPDVLAATEAADPQYPWVSAEVVNSFADKCYDNGWFGRTSLTRIFSLHDKFSELVQRVHPAQRRYLTSSTMALLVCHGSYALSSWVEFFTDWAKGSLEEQPTPAKVAQALRLGVEMREETDIFQAIAKGDQADLILGEAQNLVQDGGLHFGEAVYLVFTHYFGTNTVAWQTGLELREDWEGTLEELALTTCAVVGIDLPAADAADPDSVQD